MQYEMPRYINLLQRRVETLGRLAAALESGQFPITHLDVNGIYEKIALQENLCAEMQFLNRELETLQNRLAAELQLNAKPFDVDALAARVEPADAERLRLLLSGLAAAQADVRRLNRVYAGLVRRSRRSINVLMTFMANLTGTYGPPESSPRLHPPAGVGVY